MKNSILSAVAGCLVMTMPVQARPPSDGFVSLFDGMCELQVLDTHLSSVTEYMGIRPHPGKAMANSEIRSLVCKGLVNLVAVAEVDETRLGKVKEAFPDVKVYKDWRVLLEKEHTNLDSVNVSTPDHMHAPSGRRR